MMNYSESLLIENAFLLDAEATERCRENNRNNDVKVYSQRDSAGNKLAEIKVSEDTTDDMIKNSMQELQTQKDKLNSSYIDLT